VTDFLGTKRKEIDDRLKELKPLVEEYRQLEAAAAALQGVGSTRRGPGRPKGSAGRAKANGRRRSGGSGRRGRPRGSGTRSIQAMEIVKAKPGITIPELAAEMGIKQNYLYRVLPTLQQDGKVKKKGKGWHPAASA